MKKLLYIAITLGMTLGFAQLRAQTKIKDGTVTGSSPLPQSSAVLELESNVKGLLIPRLTTSQRNSIAAANLADGLMLYNTDEGCYDYYQASTTSWVTYCGSASSAAATFSITSLQCSAITANGNYSPGNALTPANYLAIPVTVTAPGSYTITGTTTNGYFFSVSGVFPGTGTFTVNVPGTGTPVATGTDNVTLKLNGVTNACSPTIKVGSVFSMGCGSITVNGYYLQGTAVDGTDYLTIPVTVTTVGPYTITSNTVNGYSFSTSGTFTSTGSQTITIPASGTPALAETDYFTITGGTSTCHTSVTVYHAFPRKIQIAAFGSGATDYSISSTNFQNMLNSSANFGTTGKVPTLFGFNVVGDVATPTTSAGISAILHPAGQHSLDILVSTYPGTTMNNLVADSVKNWIKNEHGTLILITESTGTAYYSGGSTNSASAYTTGGSNNQIQFLNDFYGFGYNGTTISAPYTGSPLSDTFKIASSATDPIINGPFGNLSNLYLRSDKAGAQGVFLGLPAGQTTTLATGYLPTAAGGGTNSGIKAPFSFRDNTYGLLAMSDAGFILNTTDIVNSTNALPSTTLMNTVATYDTHWIANALGWAINSYLFVYRVN